MMKSSSPRLSSLLLAVLLVLVSAGLGSPHKEDDHTTLDVPKLKEFSDFEDFLSYGFYHQSCPEMESIVHRKVSEWIKKDYTLAASLIRLHFHDCAVRGCDASILLDYDGSERRAAASRTLRGFDVINDIKLEMEKRCPKLVSCADILTSAARDATVLVGGPYWMVPYGRKDGRDSIAKETEAVPMGLEKITNLVEIFQSKGLNVLDLVVLSGAHTIGRCSCSVIQDRLFNYSGSGKADPSMDPKYLNFLKRKCRWASDFVDLDPKTPKKFDSQYFLNLPDKMGLLPTDALLYSDSRTSPLAKAFAYQPSLFNQQFAVSMAKLGNVEVLTGPYEGEIRTNCNFLNPHS